MELSDHEKEKVERLRRAMYSRSLSGLLKERPRRVLGQAGDNVGDDFLKQVDQRQDVEQGQATGPLIASEAVGFARTALWWLMGAALLFFVGAMSFFGYYFLLGEGKFGASSGNIEILVTGPQQVEGGAPTQLQVAVTNKNKVPLEVAELIITYPSGTRSSTDFVTDLPTQKISLGAIGAGETRRGTVSAIFAGNERESIDVSVELQYQIQGSNAVFVSSGTYGTTLSSSPLSLAIEGNKEAISGQPIEMKIEISSNSSSKVGDVLFEVQYPFGFKFTSASPAPNRDGLWEIGDLDPGQKVPVTIRGILTGEQGDDRIFRVSVGTRRSVKSTSIETVLAKNVFPIAISKPFLGLTVSVAGGESTSVAPDTGSFQSMTGGVGANLVVAPGDDVHVSILWQNNLPTAINDVVIAARLSGLSIDGSTVRTKDGFYRSSDNIVLWDKSTSDGVLAKLTPGARGAVGFTFKVPGSSELAGVVNPKLDISINAAGKRISETGVPESLQSSVTKRVAIASDVGLVAQGLYYANPFGSVGPMPAKAGKETTYALFFAVTNSTNEIKEARMTARLPLYARWIYRPTSENIRFNQTDGTITWDIGTIAPGVGLNGTAPRQAIIAIGFTPSVSQIGQEPPLLQDIELWGIDTVKAEEKLKSNPGAQIAPELLRSAKDITTNIQGDPGFSSANAAVVK